MILKIDKFGALSVWAPVLDFCEAFCEHSVSKFSKHERHEWYIMVLKSYVHMKIVS